MDAKAKLPEQVVLEARSVGLDVDGVRRLRHITFRVCAGHIMCVIGENGSGKSLLLQVLAGDYPVTAGSLTVDSGVDVFRVASEQVRANALLTVDEYLNASTPDTTDEAVGRAFETYGLKPSQSVGSLSSGEQQRLLLASAGLSRAGVTLFDLPVSQLDSAGFDLAEDLIRSLADGGCAVVVATTNPELVLRLDDGWLHRMHAGLLELVRARPERNHA